MTTDLSTFQRTIDDDVVVRTLNPEDSKALFALVDQNRAYLRPWLSFVDRTRYVTDVQRFIDKAKSSAKGGATLQAGIYCRGELVGVIGVQDIDATNRKATIGYWLAQAYQGRGLMSRACEAVIKYLFDDLGLHRIEIHCAPENTRSRAIPERLGFTAEGTLRKAVWVSGQFLDQVVYAVLDEEWRAHRARLPPRALMMPECFRYRGVMSHRVWSPLPAEGESKQC